MKTVPNFHYLTYDGIIVDADGYIQGRGISVTWIPGHNGQPDLIGIGSSEYRRDDLEITESAITGQAGWKVVVDGAAPVFRRLVEAK